MRALVQVLEEKLVRRTVSLKSLDLRQDRGGVEGRRPPDGHHHRRHQRREGPGGQPVHQGARGTKGVSSQTQGEQVRVSAKKRDDLQAVIAALKEHDFGIPLQFKNFRD